jgi:ubiquinone biosynthesis O-methyltransferase
VERGLEYAHSAPAHTAAYLEGPLLAELEPLSGATVLDIGCGNGALTASLAKRGAAVTGLDLSESGIALARAAHPDARFEVASVYDDLHARFGTFDRVVALEVIEHLYDPRMFVRRAFEALKPGGRLVLSTPFHSYLKNLALAVSGKLDAHFTVLWDGGHIKFFSQRTLETVLREAGFEDLRFQGAGRVPLLWKSLVASARRPAELA